VLHKGTPSSPHRHALLELAQLPKLRGDSHAQQIAYVPDGLEIPTDEEHVGVVAAFELELAEMSVDRVELAVAAAFDCNLRVRRVSIRWY
jgi:hypothetical protein